MVYVTHGLLEERSSERISHALMFSRWAFVQHLLSRPTKYVSLEDAAAGLGDALTVDDATRAGFEQAILARRFGHAVTWSVNGDNVQSGMQYFPFLLSWMLDETRKRSCFFEQQLWPLETLAQRKDLRRRLKHVYMRFTSIEQVEHLVQHLAAQLDLSHLDGDPELRTVSRWELEEACRAGVRLVNHGWTHLNPQALSPDRCMEELSRNAAWIQTIQPDVCGVYAPPYGAHVALPEGACTLMLLADRSMPGMFVNPRSLNRCDLVTEELLVSGEIVAAQPPYVKQARA